MHRFPFRSDSSTRTPRRAAAPFARWAVLFGLLASAAQAAWSDLREGLDAKAAAQQVGSPLIQNRARGRGLETWTYDDGGYILLQNGKVRYWQAPREKKS